VHEWVYESDNHTSVIKKQIPLIIAWAITIHKSQGMSLDYVSTNLGDNIFEYGQAYVVLSRVKNLEGLTISEINFNKIIAHPKVIDYYNNLSKNIISN
jgi:ATP-dependent DNA helicase PIF1